MRWFKKENRRRCEHGGMVGIQGRETRVYGYRRWLEMFHLKELTTDTISTLTIHKILLECLESKDIFLMNHIMIGKTGRGNERTLAYTVDLCRKSTL